MDYEKLLEKAEKELPEKTISYERFKIDKVKGHLEGNKTILINLNQIAKQLSRKLDHLLKYLLRELATPGKIIRGRVILGSKVPASLINKKIKKYMSEFLICSECGKPDTELLEIEKVTYLKCLVCGVKKPVKSLN
ncbi:translation initiation factor IF-2 subunit beta [Candidatus Woesearchaeota archaeon]|nr:translation initiation factor IF-2 subunit beta [Candidatus Woesearchaeota archaeon]